MSPRLAGCAGGIALLTACGGGGGGAAAPPPPPASYLFEGAISVIADSLADSDVNDPNRARVSNDDPGEQQALRNPVTLGGYANRPGEGPPGPSHVSGDVYDSFIVPLDQGQHVNLFIADPGAGDLDLYLLDSNLDLVDSSEGIGQDETVSAPASATYTVLVYAYSGASAYLMQVGAAGPAAMHSSRYGLDFVPGEVLVLLADPRMESSDAAARLGLVARDGIPGRAMRFGLPRSAAPPVVPSLRDPWAARLRRADPKRLTLAALKDLQRRPEVGVAEPNLLRRASLAPNDPGYASQWHYRLINLPQAWDVTQGSADVVVAVIDTGVVLNHPELAGQLDPQDPDGFDFISNPSVARDGDGRDHDASDPGDGQVGSSSFHGTHVAGTIAAATDNSAGVSGAGWNTRIMPLRVLGRGGGTSFDIQQAVLYAAGLANASGATPARRADVANLSLGGGGFSSSEQQVYNDALGTGLLIVAAAGNSGNGALSYPASYNGVVSVASVGPTRQRAYYSQFNAAVDVAAPGGDQSTGSAGGVLSTHANDSGGSIASTYAYLQGTSMATPHVAAVMALMKAIHPGLSQGDFTTLLANGSIAEDLGPAGRDDQYGHGLIDARKALAAAMDLAGGAPPGAAPLLASSTGALEFGSNAVGLAFDLRNAGGGSLTVTSLTDDQPWAAVAGEAVRADGTGRYRVSVNRAGLAPGLYSGTVTATSSANAVQVRLTLQVSSASLPVDAGFTYVLLVDPDTFETLDQADVPVTGGRYPYRFPSVPAGRYSIIAGSDQDNDGFICDAGESCGAYPTLSELDVLQTGVDVLTGLDYLSGFSFGANAEAAATGSPAAPAGWRRLR